MDGEIDALKLKDRLDELQVVFKRRQDRLSDKQCTNWEDELNKKLDRGLTLLAQIMLRYCEGKDVETLYEFMEKENSSLKGTI